jgi:peroxiredoxin Q/BCP
MTKAHYIVIALSLALVFSLAAWFAAAAAPMPKTGTPAPAFTLANQEGKDVSLDQFRGKWVVLYFYPKDFTRGCSVEAHNFQSDAGKYIAKNAVIIGVSADTVDSHKSFCAKEGLNFILLSDTQHAVSKTYGSLMNIMGKTLSARNTFLVDPAGVIQKVYTKVNPATHSDDVLADLTGLEKAAGK